jgi:hypothetical protein
MVFFVYLVITMTPSSEPFWVGMPGWSTCEQAVLQAQQELNPAMVQCAPVAGVETPSQQRERRLHTMSPEELIRDREQDREEDLGTTLSGTELMEAIQTVNNIAK